jgi:hypothetical protein
VAEFSRDPLHILQSQRSDCPSKRSVASATRVSLTVPEV